jgi:hypothetical protein
MFYGNFNEEKMATQLTTIEPIPLPNSRRPAMLPSLPAWAARSSGAVRLELQMTLDGKTFEKQDVLVLPKELMPNTDQRAAMAEHIDNLRSYLRQTPEQGVEYETRVATAVSKLLVVLAGEKKSELAEEARSDVYLEVLSDVQCWAVEDAIRKWFRHDCGTDERGRPHDYKWAPDPGTLRQVAIRVAFELSARIGKLQRVLDAREYVDCSKQLSDGLAAMRGLKIGLKDLSIAAEMTFDDAVKLGSGL